MHQSSVGPFIFKRAHVLHEVNQSGKACIPTISDSKQDAHKDMMSNQGVEFPTRTLGNPPQSVASMTGGVAEVRRSRRSGWLPKLLVLFLGVAGLVASLPARAQGEELLGRILAAVAREPLAAMPFFERRLSPMLAKPLESRGTLTYSPNGSFEKVTTAPIREKLIVTAETVSVQSGDSTPKVIRLETQPALAAYIHGVRAVLAGDAKPLRSFFEAQVSGGFDRWELKLVPIDATLKKSVRQVLVRGERGLVRLIETSEVAGDTNELTLVAGGNLTPVKVPR